MFTNIMAQFRLSVAKIGTLLGGFALGFLVYLYVITRANPLNGFFGDSRAALFGLIVELAADMHHAGQRLPTPWAFIAHIVPKVRCLRFAFDLHLDGPVIGKSAGPALTKLPI